MSPKESRADLAAGILGNLDALVSSLLEIVRLHQTAGRRNTSE